MRTKNVVLLLNLIPSCSFVLAYTLSLSILNTFLRQVKTKFKQCEKSNVNNMLFLKWINITTNCEEQKSASLLKKWIRSCTYWLWKKFFKIMTLLRGNQIRSHIRTQNVLLLWNFQLELAALFFLCQVRSLVRSSLIPVNHVWEGRQASLIVVWSRPIICCRHQRCRQFWHC